MARKRVLDQFEQRVQETLESWQEGGALRLSHNEIEDLKVLENHAVNKCAMFEIADLNRNWDHEPILKRWNENGFVFTGLLKEFPDGGKAMWCRLSPAAFRVIAEIRRKEAEKVWKKKEFKVTNDPEKALRDEIADKIIDDDHYWVETAC